jgi:hypothetical protein
MFTAARLHILAIRIFVGNTAKLYQGKALEKLLEFQGFFEFQVFSESEVFLGFSFRR